MKYLLTELHWQQFEVLSFNCLRNDVSKSITFIEGGNDGGRDLLFKGETDYFSKNESGEWLFQVKHKQNKTTGYQSLKNYFKNELSKIFIKNNYQYDKYVLVTNLPVSASFYDKLNDDFISFCDENKLENKDFLIYGYRHFEGCINKNSYIKWLFPSIIKNTDFKYILSELLNRTLYNRHKSWIRSISSRRNHFVLTSPFILALNKIEAYKIILFSGPAKSGKTFNAEMIAFKYVFDNDYEFVKIDLPEEFEQYYDENRKQIFLFDDAFGIHNFSESRLDIWERKLANIFNLIDETHKFIFTSREHIYNAFSRQASNFSEDFFKKITVQPSDLTKNERLALLDRYINISELEDYEKNSLKSHSNEIVTHINFSPESIRTFFLNSKTDNQTGTIRRAILKHLDTPDEFIRILFKNFNTKQKAVILSILCSASNDIESISYTFDNLCKDINCEDIIILLNEEIKIFNNAIVKIESKNDIDLIKFYHPTMIEYFINVIQEPGNSLFKKAIFYNINTMLLDLCYLHNSKFQKSYYKNKRLKIEAKEFDNLKIGLTRFIQNPSTELHQIISVLKFLKTADIVFLKIYSRYFYDNVTVFVKDLLSEILKKSFITNKQNETNDKWSDFFLNASRVMVQYSIFKRDIDLKYYEELLLKQKNSNDYWKLVFSVALFIEGDKVIKIIGENWLKKFEKELVEEIYSLGNELFGDDFPMFEKYQKIRIEGKDYSYERLKNKPNKKYYPRYIICEEKYEKLRLLKWNTLGQKILNKIVLPFGVLIQISGHAKNFHYHNKFVHGDDWYDEREEWEYDWNSEEE